MAELISVQAFKTESSIENESFKSLDVLKLEYKKRRESTDTVVSIPFDLSYTEDKLNKNCNSLPEIESFIEKPQVSVTWNNIELTASNGKAILKGLSGAADKGKLTAIIGPSGAGKSTLLNVLSGFTRQKVNGEVLVNGIKCDRDVYRKFCSYIMQEDYLLPHLTVKETINTAASLKIPTTLSDIDKQKIVDECLITFGLVDCQNTRASKLSGGEKKRLCIAQELVSNPSLIFLDEPTSGLDSLSCLQCVKLLKSLAEEGRTIVCTIHQPSSKILQIFDKVYIMADGLCIYEGPTKELIPFFAAQGLECPKYHNPANFATEIASGEYGQWVQKLAKVTSNMKDEKESSFPEEDCEQKNGDCNHSTLQLLEDQLEEKHLGLKEKTLKCDKIYETSYWHQFRILTWRTFISTLREPLATQLRFLSHLVAGIFFGLVYFDTGNKASKFLNNLNFLLTSILLIFFCALMPTVLTFSLEKSVFVREQLNCWYDSQIYFMAKTVSEIPFQILFPVTYGSIVYWMTSQPPELFRFALFIYCMIMLCIISQSFGLIIGAAFSMQNAVFMAPLASMPFYILGGLFIDLDNSILRNLSYLSYVRYIYQSMLLTLYSMDRKELECDIPTCLFTDPMQIVRNIHLEDGNLFIDFVAQWAFVFIFRCIAYFVLWYKTIHNR